MATAIVGDGAIEVGIEVLRVLGIVDFDARGRIHGANRTIALVRVIGDVRAVVSASTRAAIRRRWITVVRAGAGGIANIVAALVVVVVACGASGCGNVHARARLANVGGAAAAVVGACGVIADRLMRAVVIAIINVVGAGIAVIGARRSLVMYANVVCAVRAIAACTVVATAATGFAGRGGGVAILAIAAVGIGATAGAAGLAAGIADLATRAIAVGAAAFATRRAVADVAALAIAIDAAACDAGVAR